MVYVVLEHRFEEAEALVTVDLLRRAGIKVAMVSHKGEDRTGCHYITVKADLPLAKVDLTDTDMIVLPGGSVGVRHMDEDPAVAATVQEALDRGAWVAAICAAPTLLGKWGHLKGKKAVCYPGMEEGLLGADPQPDCGVVVDGKIITGRAAGSVFEFGLKLIEVLAGKEKSEEVRNSVYYG